MDRPTRRQFLRTASVAAGSVAVLSAMSPTPLAWGAQQAAGAAADAGMTRLGPSTDPAR